MFQGEIMEPITDAELKTWEIDARDATPGKWFTGSGEPDDLHCGADTVLAHTGEKTMVLATPNRWINTDHNAAHIANACPENVLRLIAALRQARVTADTWIDKAATLRAALARKDKALRGIVATCVGTNAPHMSPWDRLVATRDLARAALDAPKEGHPIGLAAGQVRCSECGSECPYGDDPDHDRLDLLGPCHYYAPKEGE